MNHLFGFIGTCPNARIERLLQGINCNELFLTLDCGAVNEPPNELSVILDDAHDGSHFTSQ